MARGELVVLVIYANVEAVTVMFGDSNSGRLQRL
jgi:hypothetical protein